MNTKDIYKSLKSLRHSNVDFPESEKKRLLDNIKKSSKDREAIKLALVHLALCHNVICEGEDYTSSSPDEVALASFARYIGYKFIGKNSKNEVEIS
jgi:magnesium-transporting ATPase (P-type)